MTKALGPISLEGNHVRLEPLNVVHARGLLAAGVGLDWAWMPYPLFTEQSIDRFISEGLKAQEVGESCPFTIFSKDNDNLIVGSTRYLEVRSLHKGVEIGWTWYSPKVWHTYVNPECKYLLLRHAFEDWDAIRVQLKTDSNNVHSQNAILKLGAQFEGKLRNHMIRNDGTIRDTMMYSITKENWPVVKEKLLQRIKI